MNSEDILIIGATSDIAMASAEEFANRGFSVSLAARDTSSLQERAADLGIRSGQDVALYSLDVCDAQARARFLAEFSATPEVILFCVGYLGDQTLAQTDSHEAEKILQSNYLAAVQLLSPLAERMAARGQGTMIAVSSVAGDRGRASNYFYGSAKAGLSAYLSGLRNRLFESGVHVIDIKPGFVDTRMTAEMDLPAALTAQPEEVAARIYRAWREGWNTVYVKPVWRLIMLLIRHLPEFLFKRTHL